LRTDIWVDILLLKVLEKQVYAMETNPNEQVNVEMLKVSLKDSE
jgi:hypothetical protein